MKLIKNTIPIGIYDALRWSYWIWLKKAAWSMHPASWVHTRRLQRYRDRHTGQRCFIIGSGPSLNHMDLRPLKHEYTFGLNRIYLLFTELGFTTTYYAAMDINFMRNYASDIAALNIPKFLLWFGRPYIPTDDDTIWIHDHPRPHFTTNPARWLWGSQTVTYMALQLAYYMGFQQAILIGVDHAFSQHTTTNHARHSNNETLDAEQPAEYFTPNYISHDTRNLPLRNLKQWELAYGMAREAYHHDGREILDATVGGKLQIFPKVDYKTLWNQQ
jgi:hypothetical protein